MRVSPDAFPTSRLGHTLFRAAAKIPSRLGRLLILFSNVRAIRAIHSNKSEPSKSAHGAVTKDLPPSWEKWLGHDSPELPWPWDMEGDAQSLLEIQLAEQQAETVCNTNKQHSICQNTVLCSLLQQLKTKLLPILILLLFGLSGLSAQDTAQTTPPQWSDPKIPTPFAQVLEERGQLDSVDYAFDRIAYYPWQGFAWHPPLIAPPKKPKTVLTTDVILADNIRETMVAN